MMRVRLPIVILVGMCCLALSQEARANRVNANTDVYYDAAQNRMVGYTEATSSYSAGMYYCLSVTVYLTTEGQWAGNSAWDGCVDGYAYTQTTLPYDPNAEYNVSGEHTAEPYYRDAVGNLIDYYNFQVYLEGIPVYSSGTYQFYGPGPRRPSVGAIFLGTVMALFSQLTRHGPPDHLYVTSSRNRTRTDLCNQVEKQIDFLIVDSSNRAAGRVNLSEEPKPGLTDSCSGQQVRLQFCSGVGVGLRGNFTDTLRTGCPDGGGVPPDSCGFDFGNIWRWCDARTGTVRANLAWMYYDVHHGYVKVDGQTDVTPQHKYP